MAERIVVFTDRHGDGLSVTPRNVEGNTIPDPVITVSWNIGTPGEQSSSVVFTEPEFVNFISDMINAMNLSEFNIETIAYNIRFKSSERR